MTNSIPMPGTIGGAKVLFKQTTKSSLPKIGIVGLGLYFSPSLHLILYLSI
jgi:hypothetical protein